MKRESLYSGLTKNLREENPFHPDSLKQLKNPKFQLLFSPEAMLFWLGAWMNLFIFLSAKTQITNKMVYPIFYDVKPAVIRKQTETFQEAFAQYEEVFSENIEKVQKRRDALREVARLIYWAGNWRTWSFLLSKIYNFLFNDSIWNYVRTHFNSTTPIFSWSFSICRNESEFILEVVKVIPRTIFDYNMF